MTFLEQVARAMYAAAPERLRGGEQAIRWEHIHPLVRDRYCVQARAAVCAMREPTPTMVEAASFVALDDARGVWRDMINGALTEAVALGGLNPPDAS